MKKKDYTYCQMTADFSFYKTNAATYIYLGERKKRRQTHPVRMRR